MSGKHFTLLAAALLMFAACSEDVTDIVQDTPANDPLAGYDGPLSVNISFGSTTRTTTSIGTSNDAVVGSHPFPTTSFSEKDTVGIVQVATKNGISQVFNFMAVTADYGTTWAIKDVNGQDAIVRHFLTRENTYFAYSPYKAGGLVEGTDFSLSTLPTVTVQKYNEYSEPAGTETVTTPAYKFFEKMIDRVLGEHSSQSTLDDFKACDLLGARGVATTDMTARTATLNFALDHILALDILALKKLDGNLTIYGAYDTWVAPNNDIWRMKQQMRPTMVNRSQVSDFPNAGAVSSWYHASTTGDYQFYMQLVKDRTPRKRIGDPKSFADGGWLVDIPAVPAGHYAVVTNPYFRFFREKGFTPSETNIAGTTWKETWKKYYHDRPYTWTYEEVLFPDVANVYDYNDILEVGDKLLSDGNISKASSSATGVGTVKWIAYAPAPWLSTSSTYQGWQRSNFFSNYIIYTQSGWSNNEVKIPATFYDNGYRPYGMEIETGGVKHLSINYTANGCTSLDNFWRTDVCNHFMVFKNEDVTYKSTDEIKHDDSIFGLAIPSIAVSSQGEGLYLYNYNGKGVFGFYPHSWAFFKEDWQLNKDGENGVRSNIVAPGLGYVGTSQWMVPTVAQYYMANYSNVNYPGSKDLLTCNYLPGKSGLKEGLVMLKGGYGYLSGHDGEERPVYFGDGYVNFFSFYDQVFNSVNIPLNNLWNYTTLPISGVNEATGEKRTSTGITTPTTTVTIDKLNIASEGGKVFDVPTDYTPCICY